MAVTVQALERGLDLLELVLQSPHGLSLNELAQRLDIAPPTAFNLAHTLINRGLLKKSGRPVLYLPGDRLSALTPQVTTPDLGIYRDLREAIGAESVLITKAIEGDSLIKVRVNVHRPSIIETPDRLILSPYTFASSLCIMAFLSGEERTLYRQRYPFSLYGLPAWESENQLDDFLTQAAKRGYIAPAFDHPPRLAVPIWGAGETLWGSLGASFSEPLSEDRVIKILSSINQTLTPTPALP